MVNIGENRCAYRAFSARIAHSDQIGNIVCTIYIHIYIYIVYGIYIQVVKIFAAREEDFLLPFTSSYAFWV